MIKFSLYIKYLGVFCGKIVWIETVIIDAGFNLFFPV